jgi:hypothetical protein
MQAQDAILIDTSDMTVREQVEELVKIIRDKYWIYVCDKRDEMLFCEECGAPQEMCNNCDLCTDCCIFGGEECEECGAHLEGDARGVNLCCDCGGDVEICSQCNNPIDYGGKGVEICKCSGEDSSDSGDSQSESPPKRIKLE